MATKPTPGASDGTYGTELNAFLDVSLDTDGKVKNEALQTTSAAPVADAALANKLYVDNKITSYDTGWIANNDWTNVHLGTTTTGNDVNHALTANLSDLIVKVLISTDGTDANSFEMSDTGVDGLGAGTSLGITIYQVDTANITVQTGLQGILYLDAGGTSIIIDTESWYYKVKVWKLT